MIQATFVSNPFVWLLSRSVLALLVVGSVACDRPEAPGNQHAESTQAEEPERSQVSEVDPARDATPEDSRTSTLPSSADKAPSTDLTTTPPGQDPASGSGEMVADNKDGALDSNVRIPLPFRAQGNEPFWSLVLTDTSVEFNWNSGQNKTVASITERTVRGDEVRVTAKGTHAIEVVVEDKVCNDTMSGMPYPYVVSAFLDSQMYTGCGGESATLLDGSWTVDKVAGLTSSQGSATLRFSGKAISGTTACNSYNTMYNLSGEGFSVGAIATTRKACPPDLMNYEAAFLHHLEEATRFDITSDGLLVITSRSGETISARR